MSLGLPSRIKYINMRNQKRERIFASRVADRQLIDVTPLSQDKFPTKVVDTPRRGAKLGKER